MAVVRPMPQKSTVIIVTVRRSESSPPLPLSPRTACELRNRPLTTIYMCPSQYVNKCVFNIQLMLCKKGLAIIPFSLFLIDLIEASLSGVTINSCLVHTCIITCISSNAFQYGYVDIRNLKWSEIMRLISTLYTDRYVDIIPKIKRCIELVYS